MYVNRVAMQRKETGRDLNAWEVGIVIFPVLNKHSQKVILGFKVVNLLVKWTVG